MEMTELLLNMIAFRRAVTLSFLSAPVCTKLLGEARGPAFKAL